MGIVTASVVVTVVVALVVSAVFSRLTRGDDTTAIIRRSTEMRGQRFSPNASVVIPGAWRVPRTPAMRAQGIPGHLSRAFQQRVERGVRVAAATGITHIIFSGGNDDSILARRSVVEAYGRRKIANVARSTDTAAANKELDRALAEDIVVNVTLVVPVGSSSTRWPPLRPSETRRHREDASDNAGAARTFVASLWIENFSTTTASNANYTAALLEQHLPGTGEVVVVSSPYHLPRCRIYFGKALASSVAAEGSRRDLYFVASPREEFQCLLPPDPAWVSVEVAVAESDTDKTGLAPETPTCARPHCIVIRHTKLIGRVFPVPLLRLVHSLMASWRAWSGVALLTVWSTEVGAWAREVVAFGANFVDGRFTRADLRYV